MKCFTHPATDAVAICKSCGRGLCPECYVEIGTASTCKNRCETDAKTMNQIVAQAATSQRRASGLVKTAGGAYLRSGLFCLAMGLGFAAFGYFTFKGGPGYFFMFFGLLFFIYGLSQLWAAKKYQKSS